MIFQTNTVTIIIMKFAANNSYKVSPISVIYLGSPHIHKPHALALYHYNRYKKNTQAWLAGA